MAKRIRLSRTVNLLSVLFVLVVGFQNCEEPQWLSSSSSSAPSKPTGSNNLSGGNGGGYDGKLQTTFYRFVPRHQCVNLQGQYLGKISLDQTSAILTEQNQCQSQQEQIVMGDLQFSLNDPTLIGYKNNIYVTAKNQNQPDQNSFTEVWCYDPEDKKRELIIKYNEPTQTPTALFFERDQPPQSLGVLSRLLSNTEALYKSSLFEIQIDKNQKNNENLYLAKLKRTSNSLSMICRLGGYLDSTLWPAIDLGEGTDLLFSPDKKWAYQIQKSKDAESSNQLIKTHLETQKTEILVPSSRGHFGLKKLKISESGEYLVFLGDTLEKPFVFNIYSLAIKSKKLTQLNSQINTVQQSVFDFKISSDNRWVFFTDGKDFDISTNLYQLILRQTPITGEEEPISLSANPPQFAPGQRIAFPLQVESLFSTPKNSPNPLPPLYFFQISDSVFFAYDLWRYDLPLNQKQLVFRSTPDKMLLLSSTIADSPQANTLLLTVYNKNLSPEIIALTPQGIENITAINSIFSSYYDPKTESWIILTNFDRRSDLGQLTILNSRLTVTHSLSFKGSLSLNDKKDRLLFIDSSKKMRSYNWATTNFENICADMDDLINFTSSTNGDIFVVKNDLDKTSLIKASTEAPCQRINTIPRIPANAGVLVISPDSQSLVLNVGALTETGVAKEIIWIPLKGQSAVKVDTSETPGKIWRTFFNEQSSQLFYLGVGHDMSSSILFSWSLPR